MSLENLLGKVSGADMSVDHALENGLSFVEPKEMQKTIVNIPTDFTQEELRKRSAEVNAARKEADRAPRTLEIDLGDPDNPDSYGYGRVLNAQLFNEGVLNVDGTKDLIIFNYAWNAHYGAKKGEGPVSEQQEAEYLAAAFPDKQILFINQPGFGGSSLLPKEIADDISETGNYAPLGEYIGEKVSERISDEMGHLATIAVFGESLGALRASAITGALVDNADTVRAALVEAPGSKEHSLLGLGVDYVAREGYHTMAYRNAAEAVDPDSTAARKASSASFIQDKVLKKKGPKDTGGGKISLSSIGKPALGDNLATLAGKGIDRVDFYSTEKCELNDWEKADETIRDIDPDKLNISHRVIPGADHAIAKAKPVVNEKIIRRLFDNQQE
jgi:hypothetical protein